MAVKNTLGGKKTKKLPQYPANHPVGMKVPKGGSSCSSCEYVSEDGKKCSNKYFVSWNGNKFLPAPANSYCCDFYEPEDEV